MTVTEYPSFAYFTVAGTALNFNISVSTCPTTNCTPEREQAAAISSRNYDLALEADGGSSNVPDLTVFAGIGVGLAVIGLATYGTINALRKIQESVEEPLV